MMCKCHKKSTWYVNFEHDDDAATRGWDGDEPLDAERTWQVAVIIVTRECTRCGARDTHDVLGGCWYSDDAEGIAYLRDTVAEHGMLPRGISLDDCVVSDA